MSTTIIGRSKIFLFIFYFSIFSYLFIYFIYLFLVDEMGSRIDDLERSIAELMEQVILFI